MKRTLLSFILLFSITSFAQKLSVAGNLQDTVAKLPLKNAIIMAIKLSDSTLVNFTRSDDNGFFKLKELPIDTYQVVITHPKFADQGFFIFGNSKNLEYDFGKIILQSKILGLEEVTIFAFRDPIYYKGDTLIYTTDSFKVKANATVEDLLKKLPGLKVDKEGKITSQGKKVDKVLVDGDEFFGSDPTVATKNLNASSIESVQVYDKKTDDQANSSTGEETQKILNLKLKDEAKKGYFGKASGASDFQKFYEGELLTNYFKKKLKLSVFGLASNTPRSSIGWGDAYKYGLNSELNQSEGDEGEVYFGNMNSAAQGIPQTLKSGIYYTDKISKYTKLNFNYTYNNNQLKSKTNTSSQYFLTDTSYTTANETNSLQRNETHSINFAIEQKIDSLTDLNFKSSIKFANNNSTSFNKTDFISANALKTRNTNIDNLSNGNGYEISNTLRLIKRFMKKDRLLNTTYSNNITNNEALGYLKTENSFFTDTSLSLNSINQKKTNFNNSQVHSIGLTYLEPITKKIKVELSYDYQFLKSNQDKKSLNNIGGEYSLLDSILTNNFINLKQTHRGGLKFIYEIKKIRFTFGSKVRNVLVNNNNIFKNQIINQNFVNILPFSTFRYKFSDNKQVNVTYRISSLNPTISELQPVTDNTNPNFITIGNPKLLPTFSHEVNLNFNTWKPISGSYSWFGANYIFTNKDITTATTFDSIGRTVSKSVNVDGDYLIDAYVGTSKPFFNKKLEIQPNLNASYLSNQDFINNVLNRAVDIRSSFSLEVRLNFEKITFKVNPWLQYNYAYSSINSTNTKPYTAKGIVGDITIKLPKKFIIETDVDYNINSKRANGYNLNYTVWNASFQKTFFKLENFILGIYAYDILNQNINVNRSITTNIITDTKSNIITRYFLLKATFKFNSSKTKEEEDEM